MNLPKQCVNIVPNFILSYIYTAMAHSIILIYTKFNYLKHQILC